MVKIEAKEEIERECLNSTRIALFSRGSDIVTLKIFNKIISDPRRLWHITDFSDIATNILVRRKLKELVKKGVVMRLRTYPAFYKLRSGEQP